jgi:hypothetical protein
MIGALAWIRHLEKRIESLSMRQDTASVTHMDLVMDNVEVAIGRNLAHHCKTFHKGELLP